MLVAGGGGGALGRDACFLVVAAALVQLCRAMMVQGLWCDGPQAAVRPAALRSSLSVLRRESCNKPETGESLSPSPTSVSTQNGVHRASYSEALASTSATGSGASFAINQVALATNSLGVVRRDPCDGHPRVALGARAHNAVSRLRRVGPGKDGPLVGIAVCLVFGRGRRGTQTPGVARTAESRTPKKSREGPIFPEAG